MKEHEVNEKNTFYDNAEFFVKPLGQVAMILLAIRIACSLVRPHIVVVEKKS